MQSSERDGILARVPSIAQLPEVSQENVSYQEVSHVFHCMQCDLQFQADIAVISHKDSQKIDAGVIRVRLDPRVKLDREG